MTGAIDEPDGHAQGELSSDLAPWFHLLSSPTDYADDAAFAAALVREHVDGQLR